MEKQKEITVGSTTFFANSKGNVSKGNVLGFPFSRERRRMWRFRWLMRASSPSVMAGIYREFTAGAPFVRDFVRTLGRQ
jgi:hypothetical protein